MKSVNEKRDCRKSRKKFGEGKLEEYHSALVIIASSIYNQLSRCLTNSIGSGKMIVEFFSALKKKQIYE